MLTQPCGARPRLDFFRKKSIIIYATIIARCLKGERSSQNALYQALADKMYGVCLRFGRSAQEAEEILQEGFIKMFSALHQYREEGSFEGWVRRIMVNTALQRYRNHSALRAIVTLDFSHELMAEEAGDLDAGLSAKELIALVQELPSAYRMVFNLYVFEGYQHKEIASMLGISEGTSKSNLHDARRWLRERIASQERIDNLKKLYL